MLHIFVNIFHIWFIRRYLVNHICSKINFLCLFGRSIWRKARLKKLSCKKMKEHWVRITFSDKQGNFPLVNTENWQVVPYNNSHSMECERILQSFFAFCYIHIQWSNLHVEWTLYLCIHLVTSSMFHFGIMAKNQTERKALETVGKNFHW